MSTRNVAVVGFAHAPHVRRTDGTTNASVPKGTQVETVTMAAAIELLNARAGMGGKKAKKTKAKTAKARAASPKKKKAVKKTA